MRSLLITFTIVITTLVTSQSFTPPNMGGSIGCVVTGKRLFSHGNYIRDLSKEEYGVLKKYKKEMATFKQKIDEAFENAENVENKNSTIPPMPLRPSMPSFCTGPDTTLYIFGGCTVQNNRVYVGKTLARDLDEEEKKKLAQFVEKMAAQTKSGTTTPSNELYKGLEFCTEF